MSTEVYGFSNYCRASRM